MWRNLSVTEIFSILGNISQFLLFLVGCFVFIQIKTAKNDLQTRCRRESLSKSMDISEKYAKEIIPKIDNFNIKFNEYVKNYQLLEYDLSDFYESEIRKEDKKAYANDINFYLSNPLHPECINILNHLEAFAMNFMKGVADEESVFSALSQTYCSFVKRHSALICRLRDPKYNIYHNLVSLYNLWYSRIEKNGLKIQEKNVQEQLNAHNIKSPEAPVPVGVKK